MAEARRIEEGEGERREQRDVRSRSQTTDHPERTKQDHINSSPGPLSTIRAAIKRTRTNSQSDHTRDRRRPEITIVSAEPLASNSWFSGGSVVFPPPQSGWPAGIQPVSQVIQEKTQEEHTVIPTAAPRKTACTTTSSTQTDPVREQSSETVPQCSAAPQPSGKRPTGQKPKKPPRPSLPRVKEPATETAGTNITLPTSSESQSDSKTDLRQSNETDSTQTYTRSVIVHWDTSENLPSSPAAQTTPSSSDLDDNQRPVPLPRTKRLNTPNTGEVKVQTLVKLGESSEENLPDLEDISSNKYLQELLEVFTADIESERKTDIPNQSEEILEGENADDEMSTNHSQRDIRARIQAFESQVCEEGNVEPAKPEPKPRKPPNKPLVAAKPSVAQKPQFNQSTEEDNQNVSTTKIPPTPAPKPPKKLVGESVRDELESIHNKGVIPKRSRPSVLTRSNCICEDEPIPVIPPKPPAKPVKEPLRPNLNINNHNSASMTRENEYVESPTNHTPVKPQRNVDSNGGSFPRQSLTRRPTTIRVPSKTDSFSDNFQDNPPPLPAQKPVGHLNNSMNHSQSRVPVLPVQESFQSGPEPSLPPRRQSTIKSLPPRPPPAKAGPGRPPPPSPQVQSRSHTASWDVSSKPQTQKSQRRGPVLPPRPNPGHRLYNNYTLPLPHGIASFDYNGSATGELSFQKNEVLLLLEEIDYNTFECQVGDAKGRVNKSRMKVITPLSSFSNMSPPQSVSQVGSGGAGLKVQAVYDFNPESPGELSLRAGDIVTMVEQVDSEWYRGTCRGSTGFFPINHVKVLPNHSPKPPPKPPSATVSGPRCVARFDFEGEHSDELSFSEGDVIQLKEYTGEEWARGKIGNSTGIFPLNFVEIIEDLPPAPSHQQTQPIRIALPGMAAAQSPHPEAAQASQSSVEWVVALYDFAGNSEGDLSFQQGDQILITQHVDAEWSCGRLNGREGMFPRTFVQSSTGQQSSNNQPTAAADGRRARALFDFTSDCDEELTMKAGDIITNLESVDDEWFLGDLRGARALVPKNYVQVLG
ncbi:SH3 domain-containing protein 19 isoform X2 [Cheilinus undulatus]|uniref:SH3 domain-containing protein 19 isoform X2 n=1 Tax=Cheilinus undulatus TaxID=241271 RepID=UPI001BD3D2E7|nr:SH3 domain-containing protein 19 isoform X2 [Cheilinus undulatus]